MTDYQRLHEIINDINYLIHIRAVFSSSEFENWYIKSERILTDVFGADSYEVEYFKSISYATYVHVANSSDNEYEDACQNGLASIKNILIEYLEIVKSVSEF